MRAKSAVLLLLALGCGLVAAIGVTQVISKDTGPVPESADTSAIIVALRDIAPGELIVPAIGASGTLAQGEGPRRGPRQDRRHPGVPRPDRDPRRRAHPREETAGQGRHAADPDRLYPQGVSRRRGEGRPGERGGPDPAGRPRRRPGPPQTQQQQRRPRKPDPNVPPGHQGLRRRRRVQGQFRRHRRRLDDGQDHLAVGHARSRPRCS